MSKAQEMITTIHVYVEGEDAERIDRRIRQFRDEALEQGFDTNLLKADITPSGAKSVDPALLGIVVVTIGPTILLKFLEFLQAWAMRRVGQMVKINCRTNQDPSSRSKSLLLCRATK